MSLFNKKDEAIRLRLKEESYSQIKEKIKVSKSTLSLWLRDYPLSKKRIRELRNLNEKRIERFRASMLNKRINRLKETYNQEKNRILPLSGRDLFLAGLFLYWGEGLKKGNALSSVSSSDPSIIKFSIKWFSKIFLVPIKKIKIKLHLYKDMNIKNEIKFWSKELKIPQNQFSKPYIKNSNYRSINYKRSFGHGTCNINIGNAKLSEKILSEIKVISDYSMRL